MIIECEGRDAEKRLFCFAYTDAEGKSILIRFYVKASFNLFLYQFPVFNYTGSK